MVENLLKTRSLLTKTIVAVVIVIVVLYVHAFFDPLQVGVEKSSRFSWERFRNIQKGQSINKVVADLGDPIREPEILNVINRVNDGGEDPWYLFTSLIF